MTSSSASFQLPAFTPSDAGTAPGLVYNADHRGEAESRLLAQFDDAPKLHALVRALVGPLQTLEQAAFEVLEAFELGGAAGAQLDVVGGLVGESRQGRSDIAYRAYVQARILANSSDGAAGSIYGIARALLGEDVLSLKLTTRPSAHYDLDVAASSLRFPWDASALESPDVVARALADALVLATSAGVSFTVLYQLTTDANTFVFADADVEQADTARGLADDEESDPGGAMIGAEERI